MKTLIQIDTHNGQNVVSARELHAFLSVRRHFATWCKSMFEYGFESGIDFTPVWGKSTGGRPAMDYALTLDMAKEISMIQRTERGKQARRYFIACEKRLQAQRQGNAETLRLKARYYDIAITRMGLNREAGKIRHRLKQIEPPRIMAYLPLHMQAELFQA
ncbi:antA/AntB antirepressor family protein [Chitinophaga barathri]|uniref:Toxin-antitoxin system, toxin component, Bro domain protein n=1 Tax=Chitinophaga barathri TaxID=1647451 RepID=A0A3N4MBF8_9BACT|nr:antA/AntB antirepressor family protein [Chitinophaga barathri]RPD39106.1 toxin-antitoxin system, toxin component, Bro domain protein [Chitinophaga barathri]